MPLVIPVPLQQEHQALHTTLTQATREPAPIGEAAREVARLLHPHFVKEEAFALPPLGLLADLAKGKLPDDPNAVQAAQAMTSRLKDELQDMLDEHGSIVAALEGLRSAARQAGRAEYVEFAEALTLHAQTEEQVLYPAALLVGELLARRSAAGAAV